MNYSLTVRAANRGALIDALLIWFDEWVGSDQARQDLRQQVEMSGVNAIRAFVSDDSMDVQISMASGSPAIVTNVAREA